MTIRPVQPPGSGIVPPWLVHPPITTLPMPVAPSAKAKGAA